METASSQPIETSVKIIDLIEDNDELQRNLAIALPRSMKDIIPLSASIGNGVIIVTFDER